MTRTNTRQRKPSKAHIVLPEPTSVVLYLRVSTKEQGDSRLGLEAQEQQCRDACERLGLEVAGVYTDVCSGAKNPLKRAQMPAAVQKAVDTNSFLMVAKLDRLSRSLADAGAYIENKLYPVTPKLLIADSPHISSLELGLRIVLAAEERSYISQRTKAALAAKAIREPEYIHGITHREQYLDSVDANTKECLRRASYYRREGHSWDTVADKLNNLGTRTSTGSFWTGNYLCRLQGKRKANKRTLKTGKEAPIPVPVIA
jgi:DNA invertase Pin-like site-specific DNA recombinase